MGKKCVWMRGECGLEVRKIEGRKGWGGGEEVGEVMFRNK